MPPATSEATMERGTDAMPGSSDAPPAKALSDQDLLALVRRSTGRFKTDTSLKRPGSEDARPSAGFTPRSFAKPATSPRSSEADPARDVTNPLEEGEAASAPQSPSEALTEDFQPAPPMPSIDLEAERRAAREEGRAEALQEIEAAKEEARKQALQTAEWDADRVISAARDVFMAAAVNLQAATDESEHKLALTIEQAVQALASERAGIAIDASPPSFMARIERLARDISSDCANAVVALNPDDLAAIEPHIEDFTLLSDAQLVAEPELARGDLRLKMGDITYADVLGQDSKQASA
ncbi:MAG: FliH/SctL family protein [Pseudomonadota bacterium]